MTISSYHLWSDRGLVPSTGGTVLQRLSAAALTTRGAVYVDIPLPQWIVLAFRTFKHSPTRFSRFACRLRPWYRFTEKKIDLLYYVTDIYPVIYLISSDPCHQDFRSTKKRHQTLPVISESSTTSVAMTLTSTTCTHEKHTSTSRTKIYTIEHQTAILSRIRESDNIDVY